MQSLQNIYKNYLSDKSKSAEKTYKEMFSDAVIDIDSVKEFMSGYSGDECFIGQFVKYADEFYGDKKDIYLEIAKYYLSKNKQKAILYLEKYKNNGGNDNSALLLLAKLYREEKDYEKAYGILKNIGCGDIECKYELLKLHLSFSKYKETEAIVNGLFEEKQFLQEVMIEPLSEIYIQNKNYSGLIKILEHNEQLFNKNEKLYYYLYVCDLNNGNIAGALRRLFDILNLEPGGSGLKREDIGYLFIDIINQNKEIILNDSDFIKDIVLKLCILTESDDANSEIIEILGMLLRELENKDKKEIINILGEHAQKSKKPRAANIFLSESEILRKQTVLKSKPRQVIISLTTKCNLRCPMCCVFDQPVYNISSAFLDFVKNNMQYMERIIWQGGEVFLYDKFDELVELAGRHKVAQDALTNGLLLNDKRLEKISKYKFHLKISIDAVEKDLYEKIRIGGKFEKLMDVVNWLKNNNTNKYERTDFIYSMAPTIMSLNYMQIDKMIDFAVEYGFQSIAFQRYIANSYDKNAFALNDKQAAFVLDKISYFQEQYKSNKLPVKIETNFVLDDKDSLLKPKIFGYAGDHKKEDVKNIDIFEKKEKANVDPDERLTPEKKENNIGDIKEDSRCEGGDNLFCVAPWLKVYFDINGILRFACNSDPINVNKYSHEQIWNCPEILEYRDSIVKNSFRLCNMLCHNSGEYGERTKLGIL